LPMKPNPTCIKTAFATTALLSLLLVVMTNACLAEGLTNSVTAPSTNRYGFTITKIEGLTVLECVHVLNEYTRFRINCETKSRFTPLDHPPAKDAKLEDVGLAGCAGAETMMVLVANQRRNYSLDLDSLDKETPFDTVAAVVQQDPEYLVTRNEDSINVAWKKLPTGPDYVLNRTVPQFVVENGDLLDVSKRLRDFGLNMHHPFIMSGTNEEFVLDYERQQCGGKKMSLHLENQSIRDVLNEVAASQSNMYWTAEYTTNGVTVSFYSDAEHAGRQIAQRHDPAIQERIRQAAERYEREWEQSPGQQPKQ